MLLILKQYRNWSSCLACSSIFPLSFYWTKKIALILYYAFLLLLFFLCFLKLKKIWQLFFKLNPAERKCPAWRRIVRICIRQLMHSKKVVTHYFSLWKFLLLYIYIDHARMRFKKTGKWQKGGMMNWMD